MYKIVTPVWKKEPVISPGPFVHPFYKTMFRKLYGLDEGQAETYTGENGSVIYDSDFLAPLVRKVWENNKNYVTRFYDIRTSEEAGQAAPEYAILKKAGIRNVSPLNIRGMGSMAWLMGLQIMGLDIGAGNCALMLLAELEHGPDAGKENTAVAFALYPCGKVDDSKGIWITDYRIDLTADEAGSAVKKFRGRVIYPKEGLENVPVSGNCIVCRGHGLTEPLLYLYKAVENAESADVMAVHRSGDRYGLVCYHVLGDGRE